MLEALSHTGYFFSCVIIVYSNISFKVFITCGHCRKPRKLVKIDDLIFFLIYVEESCVEGFFAGWLLFIVSISFDFIGQ